jgi:lipid-binding SYLF domain-containing protein
MTARFAFTLVLLCSWVLIGTGCSTKQQLSSFNEPLTVDQRAQATISRFKQKDPGLEGFFSRAAGYAVYPEVTQGGFIVGAAHGRGVLFENDRVVGRTNVTVVNVGLQAGGQSFSQVVFFGDELALRRFKRGNLEFSARASAVAVDRGAAADANYRNGVAVFTMPRGGLMVEASVGGQTFSYEPIMAAESTPAPQPTGVTRWSPETRRYTSATSAE